MVSDGFLVDQDGSVPGLVPSGTELHSGGLLVLGVEVSVGSGESGFDENLVSLDEGNTFGVSSREHCASSEEGLISEGGV